MSDDDFLPIILRNVSELRVRFISFLKVYGFFFILFIIFRVGDYNIFGHDIPLLKFDVTNNIGAQFLHILELHVLPSGTKLLILKPADGVATDFLIILFLDLIITMPYLLYQVLQYIEPALKKHERELVHSILFPASALFFTGAFFGIYFVAPELFRIFNDFDIGLGAIESVGLMSFESFLILYILLFGFSFEVPVFMYGLTRVGLVPAEYWRSHWRYAVVISLVIGMIFSPGVTGFTMIIIAIPMISLYFVGVYFSERWVRKTEEASKRVSEAL